MLQLCELYNRLVLAGQEGAISPELINAVQHALRETDADYLKEEIPLAIEQSLEDVHRVARIVRAMKEFSHPGTDDKMAVDINKSIDTTITVARNEWKYVAELNSDYDPTLPLVACFPGDFNQVMLNLIVNAAQAIGDVVKENSGRKGQITVRTRQDGDWVEIRVHDTGSGIPEPIRRRIFEPFFTTKEVGKGTGQGLAMAYNVIVKKHGGTISFETETGQGTTFIVRLPIGNVQTPAKVPS
jgi:signal transduction histidine kinase